MPVNRAVIHLASAANPRFFPGLAVALGTALLSASGRYNYRIVVLNEDLTEGQWQSLEVVVQQAATSKNMEVCLESVSTTQPLFQLFPQRHGSRLTWARLALPSLFREPAFVYLDSDVVCLQGVEAFWEALTPSTPIVAVADSISSCRGDKTLRRQLRSADLQKPYFNAGILGFNCDYFRDNRLLEKTLDCLDANPSSWCHGDQSLLNLLFLDSWQAIPKPNNMVLSLKDLPGFLALRAPANLHFTGQHKPWLQNQSKPYRYLADRIWDLCYQHLFSCFYQAGRTREIDAASLRASRCKASFYQLVQPQRSRHYQTAIASALEAEQRLSATDFLAKISHKLPVPLQINPLPQPEETRPRPTTPHRTY